MCYNIPQRFGLKYTDKDGALKQPVIIHRAIFGTFERFIGIITELYQGAFPLWLAPTQVVILPITDKNLDYANNVCEKLKGAALRVEIDARNETLQAKIRDATLQKIPYIVVIGEREEKTAKIAVRTREGKDLGQINLEDFVKRILADIASKS